MNPEHSFDHVFQGLFVPYNMRALRAVNATAAQPAGALTPPLPLRTEQGRRNGPSADESSVQRSLPSDALSTAKYCTACGHRQRWHDGGLGSCRYDECGCVGFFDSVAAAARESGRGKHAGEVIDLVTPNRSVPGQTGNSSMCVGAGAAAFNSHSGAEEAE